MTWRKQIILLLEMTHLLIYSHWQGTGLARNEIRNKLNVRYGPLPLELLDIYGTDLPDDASIVFYIHGGYWQGEKRSR